MSELGQALIQAVRDRAAENPDLIYRTPDEDQCVYVQDGMPSCLIGQALWDLGLIGPELEKDGTRIGQDGDRPNTCTVPTLAEYLKLTINGGEIEWLNMVQSRQDNDIPWGRAVATADREFMAVAS